MKTPILIEMDLIGDDQTPVAEALQPALAELHARQRPLLLIAQRPARWAPSRGRVDQAFTRQAAIEAALRQAGGVLGAVLFLDLGLFRGRRQLAADLDDVANRYGCDREALALVAGGGRIGKELSELVGRAETVSDQAEVPDALRRIFDVSNEDRNPAD